MLSLDVFVLENHDSINVKRLAACPDIPKPRPTSPSATEPFGGGRNITSLCQ